MSRRVAIITGCGNREGIGACTARALAAAGITVVVTDIAPKALANVGGGGAPDLDDGWRGLDSLTDEINASGGVCSSTYGDVTSEEDAQRMIGDALARHERLDILVNNAGAPHGAERNEIEDVPLAAWERVMAVNVRGAFLMARAAVVPMRKQGWGRIIGVSSSAATSPRRKRVAYATSKAAIVGFTKALAADLAPTGITVNAVSPGPILTTRALNTARQDISKDLNTALAEFAKIVPVGRLGKPEEVAALITFLASEASGYITGQVFGINGGVTGSA